MINFEIEEFLENDPHIGKALDCIMLSGDSANQKLGLSMLKANYSDEIVGYILESLWNTFNNDEYNIDAFSYFYENGTPRDNLSRWNLGRLLIHTTQTKIPFIFHLCYVIRRYSTLIQHLYINKGYGISTEHIDYFKDIISLDLEVKFKDLYFDFQKLKNISFGNLLVEKINKGRSFPEIVYIYLKGLHNVYDLKQDIFEYLPFTPKLRYMDIHAIDARHVYFGESLQQHPNLKRIHIHHLFDAKYFNYDFFKDVDQNIQLTIENSSISGINPPKWFLDKHTLVYKKKWISNDNI